MTESLILHLLILTSITTFSDVRASPRSSDPRKQYPLGQSQINEQLSPRQTQVKDSPGRPTTRVKTVAVTCHENYMEIVIKADLFNVGLPVDASELRLGIDSQFIPSCKVSAFSTDAYIIAAELTDCGTQHWITEEYLIYTNFLIFSPQPSPDGVIRLENALVPIECYYNRKFNITSNPIRPTWLPYRSTQFAVEDLQFSLNLMTSDWQSERASSVYFLGDVINIEASVLRHHHTNLRVFFESCVATVTRDINSVPRYAFIENHGCLMDGQLTGSKSRFLPRIQNDKLQLQLDAFKFLQERRPEMYITCTLQAYPVMDVVNPIHKACSFIDGSWKSADGGDWACYNCQKQKEFAPAFRSTQEQFGPPDAFKLDQAASAQRLSKIQPRIQASSGDMPSEVAPSWRRIIIPHEEESGLVGWEQEQTVGPLSIFPKNNKMGFLAPPRVREGVPPLPSFKSKTPIPHSSIWTNGQATEMDSKASVTHASSLESIEQANFTTSKAESEEHKEEEDDDEEEEDGDDDDEEADKDDYGDANSAADYEDYEEEKAGEVVKGLWKTKSLPDEDFETFTTLAPANEKDTDAHALDTSLSPLDGVEPADTYHPLKDS